jgi:heat shock protein HslJ
MRIFALSAFWLATIAAAAPPAASASLTGKWRVVAISGAASFDPSKTQAEFAADGHFASTIGCNRIFGKPDLHGKHIAFGPMATTRMACTPPLDQLERQYIDALEAVRGYRFESGDLVFLGAAHEELVKLQRAK